MIKLKELSEQLNAKTKAAADFYDEHFVKNTNSGQEKIDEFKAMEAEFNELKKNYDDLRGAEKFASDAKAMLDEYGRPVNDGGAPGNGYSQQKTLGDVVTESEDYQQRLSKGNWGSGSFTVEAPNHNIEGKAVMTTGTSWAPDSPRGPLVVELPVPRVMIQSLIPSDPTTLTTIKFMRESTFTNAADVVAENAPAAESTLLLTPASAEVYKIAHLIAVTEEQLSDVPAVKGIIDRRGSYGVLAKEQHFILNGTGSGQILGFLDSSSGIQTTAKGAAEPKFDALLRAQTLVRTSGGTSDEAAEPSGMVTNPTTWQNIVLERTDDGLYILGNPNQPPPKEVWGMKPVTTVAVADGTILIGDFFMFSHISRKQGVLAEVGLQADDFKNFRLSIRISSRISMEILRPYAFVKVTNMA